MPQIAPINSSLEYAIDTANTNRLRIALHHVRNQVPTAAHELQRILLVTESRAKCEVIDLDTECEVDSQQDPEDEEEDGSGVSSEAPDETESEESGESKDDRSLGKKRRGRSRVAKTDIANRNRSHFKEAYETAVHRV